MFVLESKSDPTSETKYSDSIHVDKPFEKESKMVENTVTEEKVTVEEEEKAEVKQVTDEKKDDLASRRAARLERRREKAGATSDDKASEMTEESEDGTSSSRGSLAAKRAERRARRENKPAVTEDKANAEDKVEEVQSLINERRAAHRNVADAGDDIPKRADEEMKEDTAAVRRQERRERAARRRNSKEALAKQESTLEEDHLSQARKSSSEETSKYTGIVKARFEGKGIDEQKNITSTQERRSKDSEEQLIDQRCKDENYENEVQVWSLSLEHYVFRGRNVTFFELKHKERTYGSCNLNNVQLLCIFLSKILTT